MSELRKRISSSDIVSGRDRSLPSEAIILPDEHFEEVGRHPVGSKFFQRQLEKKSVNGYCHLPPGYRWRKIILPPGTTLPKSGWLTFSPAGGIGPANYPLSKGIKRASYPLATLIQTSV
jgi:hypothetical protein